MNVHSESSNGIGILISETALERCRNSINTIFNAEHWYPILPTASEPQQEIRVAYFSRDLIRTSDHNSLSNKVKQFCTIVESSNTLAWIQLFSAGAERPIWSRLLNKGVTVTTSSGAASPTVALTAFTGMLMLARGFPAWIQAQRHKQWLGRDQPAPKELCRQKALIVGTGPIGQKIARLCHTVGVECVGMARTARMQEGFSHIVEYSKVLDVIADIDWIFLACPLSPTTRNLISEQVIQQLKPGTYLINVARGEVVDETALITGLKSEQVAGAYLDVFTHEPLSTESPLWEMPNVLVSPHAAAQSTGYDEKVDDIFLANLRRWVNQSTLQNAVHI